MTHPLTKQEFKNELEKIISNNSKISANKNLKNKLEDLKYTEESHPSNPKSLSKNGIADVGEKAFQRGIYYGESTSLNYSSLKPLEKITWIDIEIPVVLSNKSRRPCIDIIGTTESNLILCELKHSKEKINPTESPIYAVYELLIYYYFVRCNFKNLDIEKVYRPIAQEKEFNWEKYLKDSVPLLLVTANASYWKYWFKRENYKTELLKEIADLEKKLHLEIQLFETEDEDFVEQKKKGENERYTPIVESKIWTKICN
jgi:hypothetical protein